MKKIINTPEGIIEIEMTAEEIAQKEQDAIQAQQEKLVKKQEEANAILKKEEAKAKLIELGLTTEHLKALGL